MKNRSLFDVRRTIDNSLDHSYISNHSTRTIEVKSQISNKFRTFANWNYRDTISKKKKMKNSFLSVNDRTETKNMNNALSILAEALKEKEEEKKSKNKKNKNVLKVEELEGVKAERRERFKKVKNPMQIIEHYMKKENFKPNEEENILLERVVKLKEFIDQNHPMNLDLTLSKIYKIMNIAVDLNQLRFLILTVLMAAQITYESKDYVRSFHFYTQAMLATTCARMNTIKIECFIQMGKIAMDLLQFGSALKLFKKALQYSWKVKESEEELRIYDLIGQAYYYQGDAKNGLYFHYRFIQGELEEADSAVRRISYEMLSQFDKSLENTERQNLSELFIEYLTLPINNFDFYPPLKVKKPYPNYCHEASPRKNKENKNFEAKDLPTVQQQMHKLFKQLSEFKSQLPSPDIQSNFVPINKYGRPKKEVDFEQSNDYHKIVGIPLKKCDPSIFKLPVEKKIEKIMEEKQNPEWWSDLVAKTKKERQQRLGDLRNKVHKTHLSYHKYPEERKRSSSLKHEKIKETINKTLLNWIDPSKQKFL